MKKGKIVIGIILVIVLIVAVFLGFKYCKISKILNAQEENSKILNYYAKV